MPATATANVAPPPGSTARPAGAVVIVGGSVTPLPAVTLSVAAALTTVPTLLVTRTE